MAIENNQTVAIEYEVQTEGNVIDTNVGKEPLQFTFGTGQIIPGLESRIAHMNVGDKESVEVPAAEAYGEYNEAALQAIPKSQVPDADGLQPGMMLRGQGEDGQQLEVMVREIRDEEVVIDFNHPLAGKDLTFAVTILSIQ
jgi:FKBP-type peptidyl-prolyl cis-trans isomerase SlyD